jgi:hypothetical protein
MNWPNRVFILRTSGLRHEPTYWPFREKMHNLYKWCNDSLSSKGVLWNHEFTSDGEAFYFAQPQDAIMFRLVNGI